MSVRTRTLGGRGRETIPRASFPIHVATAAMAESRDLVSTRAETQWRRAFTREGKKPGVFVIRGRSSTRRKAILGFRNGTTRPASFPARRPGLGAVARVCRISHESAPVRTFREFRSKFSSIANARFLGLVITQLPCGEVQVGAGGPQSWRATGGINRTKSRA